MPQLRIAAYNVLAQCLAKSSYFPHAAGGDALKQKARFPRIFAVLARIDADVLCLSEVDCIADYAAWFTTHDYAFEYERRRGKAYGSVVAWRASKCTLARRAAADLNDIAVAATAAVASSAVEATTAGVPADDVWAQQWLTARGQLARPVEADEYYRDCVALFVALDVLSAEAAPSRIIVGATHLYWDPSFPHVRAAQAAVLHSCFRDFAASAAPAHAPCFLAGDFNALPLTEAYNILLSTPLVASSPGAVEEWDISQPPVAAGDATAPRVPIDTWLTRVRACMHCTRVEAAAAIADGSITLRSAYATAIAAGMHVGALLVADAGTGVTSSVRDGEPAFTTMTGSFFGALDHIFYAPAAAVRVRSVLPLPDEADIRVHIAMPSVVHASDHAPVAADFEWGSNDAAAAS